MRRSLPWSVLAVAGLASVLVGEQASGPPRRNVLLFVADGLRHGSVNEADTPALWRVRTQGVHFENSHSTFPTFTMANASVLATGHALGDTGVYSNIVWPGFASFDRGGFGWMPGTPVPFLENDHVLADMDEHGGGSFLGSDTLLAVARAHGYRTATLGKLGPTALQDAAAIAPAYGEYPATLPGLIVDDDTGSGSGLPLPAEITVQLRAAGLPAAAPARSNGYGPGSPYNNGDAGNRSRAGTLAANVVQQDWLTEATTRVVLPYLTRDPAAPFVLVFWSRDPDGTQHNQGDSLGTLFPGINGETSRRGVRNADRCLERLLAWLDAHPAVAANTDVVVTSDHGFATISRSEIDRVGHVTTRESARHDYLGPGGDIDTLKGTLPLGFLALDLAYDLNLDVFDPDEHPAGSRLYRKLRIGSSGDAVPLTTWEHPRLGNALLASSIARPDGADARVIVAANGGSDVIYVPNRDPETVRRVVALLLGYDYVGGIFVDDAYGPLPGTLPFSAINLAGASAMPRPTIVVAFKVFDLDPADVQTAIQVADTSLQEGQGMHGGFGRDSTYNNMAALGPDFKRAFVDGAPVGNVDVAPTLARVLGFPLPGGGSLVGRPLLEALEGGPPAEAGRTQLLRSAAASGRQTVLVYQEREERRYLVKGCFAAVSAGDADVCR